ncbi:MAG: hypothetical protein RIB59_12455 [Rhodospirillales bacterium]
MPIKTTPQRRQPGETAGKSVKKRKKGKSGLKARYVVLGTIMLPLLIFAGALIGEIFRGGNTAAHAPVKTVQPAQTSHAAQPGQILHIKNYFVQIGRSHYLRIEPYLELGKKASVEQVCYYMPRIQAAAFGAMNRYFQSQSGKPFDTSKMVQAIQRNLADSRLQGQVARVHVAVARHDLSIDPKKQHAFKAAKNAVACKEKRVANKRSTAANAVNVGS